MLEAKTFEIRDEGTFIPAVGVRCLTSYLTTPADTVAADQYLLRRAGYGVRSPLPPLVLLTRLDGGGKAEYDPYEWRDRTWSVAHAFIEKKWDSLPSGSVVDVQFLLGETKEPKASERHDDLLRRRS